MLITTSHLQAIKEHQYKAKHLKTTMKPKHDVNNFSPTPIPHNFPYGIVHLNLLCSWMFV